MPCRLSNLKVRILFMQKFEAAAINTEAINPVSKLDPKAFLNKLKLTNWTRMPMHPTSPNDIALLGIALRLIRKQGK